MNHLVNPDRSQPVHLPTELDLFADPTRAAWPEARTTRPIGGGRCGCGRRLVRDATTGEPLHATTRMACPARLDGDNRT